MFYGGGFENYLFYLLKVMSIEHLAKDHRIRKSEAERNVSVMDHINILLYCDFLLEVFVVVGTGFNDMNSKMSFKRLENFVLILPQNFCNRKSSAGSVINSFFLFGY